MLKRLLLLAAVVLLSSIPAMAQKVKVQGISSQSNVVVTAGINSTTRALRTFPSSTVTVYNQGTLTLATLWADAAGTVPKANPMTASATDASWFAYVATGRYDITFSGVGITTPFTISDVTVVSSASSTDPLFVNQVGYACTNTTADAAGLQAAINSVQAAGGRVKVSGLCNINTKINLTALGASGSQAYVSLEGDNPIQTRLTWTGATSGRLMDVTFNKWFQVSNIGFFNGVAKGTTIGVFLTGPNPVGTQTVGGRFDNVFVSGFNTGILAGAYTGFATSEMVYSRLNLDNNNTGWKNQDLNTLDHEFEMLLLGANGIGLDVSSGNVQVSGGASSSQTTADFALSNVGVPFAVKGFRSELANRFMTINGSAVPMQVSVENCIVQAITNADGIGIEATGGTQLNVKDTWMFAKIRMPLAQNASITMVNNYVQGDTDVPFFVNTVSYDSALNLKYNVAHNISYTTGRWYADESGQYVTETRVPIQTTRKTMSAVDPLGPYTRLARTRSIAFGSNAAGANLRLQEKFSSSATKAVTFVKTITVTTNAGSNTIGNTSGDINPADLGKKIVLTAAGPGGADVTGFISSINGATAFSILLTTNNGISVSSGAITATIGENEPDANYMLMLGCNADERFSWSSKATTGFTLTSSNAASTAICDIMVVR